MINVFIRTEFNTLIHNEDVTSINGIPREDLLRQYEKLTEQGLPKAVSQEKDQYISELQNAVMLLGKADQACAIAMVNVNCSLWFFLSKVPEI